MDNYAERDGNHLGLGGWELRHGKQYKKTLLTTYQSPSVSNLEAVKFLLAWSSFLPCWCSGIYLFIYIFYSKHKMFSYISTEDILCDRDHDITYTAYSNVEISRVSCDLTCSAVMYFNDQLEHLFITFYITALNTKNVTPVPYILMLVEILFGTPVEWKWYKRDIIHVIQFLKNAARWS
jgi:hypothetical protein